MTVNIRPFRKWSAVRRTALTLLWMCCGSTAYAQVQNIILNPCNNVNTTYSRKPGEPVPAADSNIEGSGSGQVFWRFTNSGGATACSGGPTVFTCAGMTVTVPPPNTAVDPTMASGRVTVTGTASGMLGAQGAFTLTLSDAPNAAMTCDGNYLLRTTMDGGGWGDPHLTTVDGTHYDFQSAGEFVALRESLLEIHTRQRAVPTTSVPGANEYTGLATCVAIYDAFAGRIGSNRVTLQPNLNGQPDPDGMQLRVNGMLVTLGADPILLRAGGGSVANGRIEGRIARAAGSSIEITDARGTQIVLTPVYWPGQQTWYLNVNVYQTSATQGTMGALAPKSWLPALPDGTSLGPRPETRDQRYTDLYETFADAWRVTDATSLFDYAPGTNTATFTIDEWPRRNATSCALEGQTAAQPATPEVATQACAAVGNPADRADCEFDVRVTGNTGFADGYVTMRQVERRPAGWQPDPNAGGPGPGPGPEPEPTGWPWWWWIVALLIVLLILALILRRKTS